MSFCGAVGKLVIDPGLLGSRKCCPTFRSMTEELLHKHLEQIQATDDLEKILTGVSSKSNTSKLWVDCFVPPTFIIMALWRSERKFDWPLHSWALRQMMPYLFAASHVHFARYGLYYLHSMETLPSEIKHYFLQEQHTMRHAASATNSTWSDMFIETTFMRYGHSQGSLTGITPNDNATQRWAISLHTCSSLISYIRAMRNQTPLTLAHHKEETPENTGWCCWQA